MKKLVLISVSALAFANANEVPKAKADLEESKQRLAVVTNKIANLESQIASLIDAQSEELIAYQAKLNAAKRQFEDMQEQEASKLIALQISANQQLEAARLQATEDKARALREASLSYKASQAFGAAQSTMQSSWNISKRALSCLGNATAHYSQEGLAAAKKGIEAARSTDPEALKASLISSAKCAKAKAAKLAADLRAQTENNLKECSKSGLEIATTTPKTVGFGMQSGAKWFKRIRTSEGAGRATLSRALTKDTSQESVVLNNTKKTLVITSSTTNSIDSRKQLALYNLDAAEKTAKLSNTVYNQAITNFLRQVTK